MLETWFIPQLVSTGIMPVAILQQDGAPAYFISVRRLLDENFPGRWIGRGSQHQWPARSPDLSSCDNALWGMTKENIRKTRYNNAVQLKAAIRASLNSISPDDLQCISARTWRRIRLCAENDGEHRQIGSMTA
ncbi:hypothetical protein BsWGS_12254 [Bradybaena similaris]